MSFMAQGMQPRLWTVDIDLVFQLVLPMLRNWKDYSLKEVLHVSTASYNTLGQWGMLYKNMLRTFWQDRGMIIDALAKLVM
jgi:hypothetical protein